MLTPDIAFLSKAIYEQMIMYSALIIGTTASLQFFKICKTTIRHSLDWRSCACVIAKWKVPGAIGLSYSPRKILGVPDGGILLGKIKS